MLGVYCKIFRTFRTRSNVTLCVALLLSIVFTERVNPLGSKDTSFDPNAPLSQGESIVEDPILSTYLERQLARKPSLEYLRAKANINFALYSKDYYKAIDNIIDMISVYGDRVDLLTDLGDTYFALGDLENSGNYYERVVENIKNTNNNNGAVNFDEIKARYKLAYINYQNDDMDQFIENLEYIISRAPPIDIAVPALLDSQGMDYTIKLFNDSLDFSYIAKRELGNYYQYNYNVITNQNATQFVNPAPSEPRDIEILEEKNLANNMDDEVIQQVMNDSILYLFSALFMSVDSLKQYISTHVKVNYQFSTLQNLVEILRNTEEGRSLLIDFDLKRILISIRNYYMHTDVSQKDFKIFYAELLIKELNFDPDTNEFALTSYYPNFN